MEREKFFGKEDIGVWKEMAAPFDFQNHGLLPKGGGN